MCCFREVSVKLDLGVALNPQDVTNIATLALTSLSATWKWDTRAGSGNSLGGLVGPYGEYRIERDAAGGIRVTGAQPYVDSVASAFRTLYQAYALRQVLLANGWSFGMEISKGGDPMAVHIFATRGRSDKLFIAINDKDVAIFDARGAAGGGTLNDALIAALPALGVRASDISVLTHEGHDGGGVVEMPVQRHLAHVHR